MKIFIYLIILTFYATSSFAQIDSIIYGVVASYPNPSISLAKIDPITGEVTTLSANSYPYLSSPNGRTIDPIHKIYYQPINSTLLAFDLTSGNLLFSRPIEQLTNSKFTSINFNCSDSTLYGVSIDTLNGDNRLSWIDPNTGIVNSISNSPLPYSINVLYGNAIDPYLKIYYYIASGRKIVGLDLATGNVLSAAAFSISQGYFGPIVFNCWDSTIYGLAGDPISGRKFAKINPVNGVVTYISSNNIAMAIYSNMATIDPFKHRYYFQTSDNRFVGVDLETGDSISDPIIQTGSGSGFYNFFYNHPCFFTFPEDIPLKLRQDKQVILYPNPVEGYLLLKFFKVSSGEIEIYSTLGKLIEIQSFTNKEIVKLNTSNVNTGIYILKCTLKESVETFSIIKQ